MALMYKRKKRTERLSLAIKDKSVLYKAYMPFVRGGGLFIPTSKAYAIGEEVFIILDLMENTEKLMSAGKIIWITPTSALGNRTAGIGIQLSENNELQIQGKIEAYLAGSLESDQHTDTM